MTTTIHVKRLQGRIDFAVITVREDEFAAVLKRFGPQQSVVGGRQIYQYCLLKRPDGRTIRVAIVRQFDQGQTFTQLAAHIVINDLRPKWLILTGIAGGIPDSEFSLGDVLLASSLHDFSVTAAIEGKRLQFRTSGGPMHRQVEALLGDLPAWRDRLGAWNQPAVLGVTKPRVTAPDNLNQDCYYGPTTAREKVRRSLQTHFPAEAPLRPPLYKIGALATANVLMKDTTLLAQWQNAARHLTPGRLRHAG